MSRILIVEDSPTQAAEIQFLLEEAGFTTDLVADGLEALESILRELPDLIVTDLLMPRMDGLSLVRAIRSDYPVIPVVLVTAHGSEDVAAQALRVGASSYVPKRNLEMDLVAVVADVLAMSGPNPDDQRLKERLVEIKLRFALDNDLSLVTPLAIRLEQAAAQMGLCDPTGQIRLAVALREATVNAIDHGNLELDSEDRQEDEQIYNRKRAERQEISPYRERRVHIDAHLTPSKATFTIRDEGPGFDPSSLPDPNDPANLERIGGRGLLLIRTFMDEVTYGSNGNQITLTKNADKPQKVSREEWSEETVAQQV